MVEYGGGISHGPAGQVSGGNPPFGNPGGVDLGASVGNFIHDAGQTLSTLSPGEMVLVVVGIFLVLLLLRRAF